MCLRWGSWAELELRTRLGRRGSVVQGRQDGRRDLRGANPGEQRTMLRGLLRGGEKGCAARLRSPDPAPAPASAELVCNRTFDKYSCWPDTAPNTTASISCPWYLPWYHKGNCSGV